MTWSPVNYGIRLKAMISKRRQFYKALWKSGQREIQICKERIILLHKLILIDTGDSYFELSSIGDDTQFISGNILGHAVKMTFTVTQEQQYKSISGNLDPNWSL